MIFRFLRGNSHFSFSICRDRIFQMFSNWQKSGPANELEGEMQNILIAGGSFAAIGLWTLAATISFAPLENSEPERGPSDVSAPNKKLLAAYMECSKAAEGGILSRTKAKDCSETYLLLKLSFLPDVKFEEFRSLAPRERWKIQQRGYAALRDWKERHGQSRFASSP